jgi:hypothetical protein
MIKKSRSHSFINKIIKPCRNLFRLYILKNWDIALLAIMGIFSIFLISYIFITKGNHLVEMPFSMADVVNGVKIYATHEMRVINSTSSIKPFSKTSVLNPNVQLSANFFDFGLVNPQQVLTHTFMIANTGDSPLVIEDAYTTCPCTVAEISASEIPTGKVALVTIKFDPLFHEINGTTIRRGLIIITNSPVRPILEIWIQATIQ